MPFELGERLTQARLVICNLHPHTIHMDGVE